MYTLAAWPLAKLGDDLPCTRPELSSYAVKLPCIRLELSSYAVKLPNFRPELPNSRAVFRKLSWTIISTSATTSV